MKNIIVSIIWLSLGILIMKWSLLFYILYIFITWIIYTIIEAKKTTGGKGLNRTVDKGSNPFK